MSNLRLRVISAAVMAVIVLALCWYGGWPFKLLCALVAAAIFFEWTRMAARHEVGGAGRSELGWVALLVVLAALLADMAVAWLLCLLALGLVALAAAAALGWTTRWQAAGFFYAGMSAVAVAALRGGSTVAGLHALIFLFCVVWATDVMAYFVGRSVGGAKLAPAISPGKTRSGALGGALGGLLAGVLAGLALRSPDIAFLAVVALSISVVSQAGDLFESWIKRRHGVKDSGALIPGHGGVMDRVDGLVAAAVALYLIGAAWGGANDPAAGLFAS